MVGIVIIFTGAFLLLVTVCVLLGVALVKLFPSAEHIISGVADAFDVDRNPGTPKSMNSTKKRTVINYQPLDPEVTGYTEFAENGELIHYAKDGFTIIGRSRMMGDELVHYDKNGFSIVGRTRKY